MREYNFVLDYIEFNLILFFSLLSLCLKLITSIDYLGILITSLFEFLTIILLFLFFKKLQDRFSSYYVNLLFFILFYFIFIINNIFTVIQSYFFDEANILRYNLMNFDYQIVTYFLNEILPFRIIILFIIFLLISYFIAYFCKFTKKILRFKFKKDKNKIFFLLIIFYIILLFNMFNYSNIYINTCTEFYQSLDDKEIILDYNLSNQNFDIIDFQDNSTINNFDDNLSIINLGNRRVLIFVMESVTYDDFIKNQNKYFLGKVRNNSHIYSNYYTTNQDSLTSIFTILTSNFIPYDAYTNNWEDLYGKKIASSLSLIDIFNQNNFYTSFFVSTYTKVGFLEFFNWTDSNYLINKENNYLCLTIFGNENGCEDRAILDDVENKIKLNKNLFLFQELIFGHGIKYNQVLKETNMEYYNSYLLDIYNFLEKENLLENTTIILVSDHGLRNVKNDESPNKYKIPLIIYNDKFNFSNNDNLFNHIDFKQILFHELYNTKLKPRNEIYYIGQTRTSIVGYLNTNNQSFTIKNNEDNILQIQSSNISDKLVNEKIYTFLKYKYKFNY